MKKRRVLSLVISASVVFTAVMTGCQQGGGGNASGQAGNAPVSIAAQSSQAFSNAGMDDLNSGVVSGSGGGGQSQQSQTQGQTPPNWLSNQSQAQSSASSSQRQVIYNQTPEVGKTVKFGAYEQDNDLSNGPEPIEWIVLDNFDSGRYCLLSVYGLDQVDYDTKDKVTAKDSYIYKWLNNDFYNEAFNEEEKAFMSDYGYGIEKSNKDYKTLITTKVALISPNNIKSCLKDDNARKAKATLYAKAKGAEVQDGQCWYWLCPTADFDNDKLFDTHAACVNYDGSIMEKISINKSSGGAVRPIILVDLDAMIKQ